MASVLPESCVLQKSSGTRAAVSKALLGESFLSFECESKVTFRNVCWCKWIWQVMGAAVTYKAVTELSMCRTKSSSCRIITKSHHCWCGTDPVGALVSSAEG